MPATTRAGAKRARNDDSAVSSGSKRRPVRRVSTLRAPTFKRSRVSSVKKQLEQFRFLDLPSELRNRVYEFSLNPSDYSSWDNPAPLLLYKPNDRVRYSTRKPTKAQPFDGLLAVNRQIRSEYRPLYAHNSCIRLQYPQVRIYLASRDVFRVPGNAPKLLQISWDVDDEHMYMTPMSPMNVIDLVRLRTETPPTKVEFVPHGMSQGINPICPGCGLPHGEELEDLDYLKEINGFLQHDNEEWLADIREDRIHDVEIQRAYFPECEVKIRFGREGAKACLADSNIVTAADEYFKKTEMKGKYFHEAMIFEFSVQVK